MAVEKPNYTQTPNRFIDEYMRHVSSYSTCVYFTICRKTIGYHKDTDEISLSQIIELSGLSKNTVLKGIAELETHLLITATRKGKGRRSINSYGLNFDSVQKSENSINNGAGDEPLSEKKGSQDEPLNNNSEKNGAQFEPLNGLNGSGDEPINPVNGAQFEHTKEINIKKEYKEKNIEPAGSSAGFKIINIFKIGCEELTGVPYYHNGKEAAHVKQLERRYEENPELFINLTRRYYWMISKSQDKFWMGKHFTPSAFNSFYNQILCYTMPQGLRKQEEQKKRTEWDVLIDQYGKYNDEKLKYLLEGGTITQRDFEYILEHRTLEVSA